MVQAERVGVSVEEYLKAGEAEVIDGELVEMTPPQFRHTEIAHILYDSLTAHSRPENLGRVYMELAYVMEGSEAKNWVRGSRVPDVSVIEQGRFDAYFETHDKSGPMWLVPDLAVEIVSSTDSYSDVTQKVAYFLERGIRLVWVIDPAGETVKVHTPDDPEGRTLRSDDTLTGDPVIHGWSMSLSEVFPPTADA